MTGSLRCVGRTLSARAELEYGCYMTDAEEVPTISLEGLRISGKETQLDLIVFGLTVELRLS
jgi:hypothetical protein